MVGDVSGSTTTLRYYERGVPAANGHPTRWTITVSRAVEHAEPPASSLRVLFSPMSYERAAWVTEQYKFMCEGTLRKTERDAIVEEVAVGA